MQHFMIYITIYMNASATVLYKCCYVAQYHQELNIINSSMSLSVLAWVISLRNSRIFVEGEVSINVWYWPE